jgi:translocation and assembly module TamA
MKSIRALLAAMLLCLVSAGAMAGEVVLEGLDAVQRANVRAVLNLTQLACDAPRWMVRWRYDQSEPEIRAALEALGFYNVTISKSLRFDEACWRARFVIEPGEPAIIVAVNIQVDGPLAEEPQVAAWRRRIGTLEGRPLHHGIYEAYRNELFEITRELGFFDARYLTRRVEVAPDGATAAIHLHLEAGERYRFGAITFETMPLRESLLLAYVPFEPGDPYSARALGRLRRNLADSGYFAGVQVDARVDEVIDGHVPVHITLLSPDRDRTYSIGGGLATDTGPRLRGDMHVRRHNDRGHRSDWRVFLSPVQIAMEGAYQIPLADPLDDRFTIEAGLLQEDTETSFSRLGRVGLRHTYERLDWIETDFVDMRLERFEVGPDEDLSRLVILGKRFSRVWGETGARPMDAVRLGGELRGATTIVGSDTDFVQVRVNSRYIRRISGDTRLLLRFEAGRTIHSEFQDLPPSVRFFAGGDNSVRGYNFRTLGEEREGEVVGGSHLLTGAVEIDYAFRPQWSVAAFVDTGSAFNVRPSFSTGAGIGLRWYSPIGPVRVDIAHPFQDRRAARFHISLGPDI